MTKTALVLVDIQNDYFEDGRWPVAKMGQVAANAARLLSSARSNGQAVFHIRHESPSESAPFFRPGTYGAQLHQTVAPQQDEPVIVKHRPNSFKDTSLQSDLKSLAITDLIICGAMSQMCIDATVRAAVDFGYKVTVIEDACGAKEQNFNGKEVSADLVHAAIMAPLAMTYASVMHTDQFLAGAF